jgi:hypothetical protein
VEANEGRENEFGRMSCAVWTASIRVFSASTSPPKRSLDGATLGDL